VTGTSFQATSVRAGGLSYWFSVAAINGSGTSAYCSLADAVQTTNLAPTIAEDASAPNATNGIVTGTSTTLHVRGADADPGHDSWEENLTYTWSVVSAPTDGDAWFDDNNGTNSGKIVTATFTKAGDYTFCVLVTDVGGKTALPNNGNDTVTVTVAQTLTSIDVTPNVAVVLPGGSQQFTAKALD
jgi:hypothetical protein